VKKNYTAHLYDPGQAVCNGITDPTPVTDAPT